ncbi:MAG: trypsin-like peptidase domain-containing protein [Erysipelotrichaceae bacterium]|nr:trypsin-like peptidase domain-containing protein [Erysipelotrichaceae bacterium]MDD7058255.1 trypsin-like peptidase domain-containing protein [Erysipelotrichaceae bacterium]MDY3660909.1 trypsin-like peptidase domain-containing protein [Bulleidia sp.]
MSQFNTNEKEPINVEYVEKPKKEKKRSFSFLTVIASMVFSLICGLGGGWFAYTHLGNNDEPSSKTGITYSDESSPSVTTTVSSNESKTGLTTSEVAAKASPSVVEIVTEVTSTQYGMFGGTYTSQAAGSGVIISKDGYIITNNHVVEDANSITVTTYDNKQYNATLVGTDPASDIAVIKIDADEELSAATVGDSSKLQAGDTAVVIGNPLGTLGGTVTDGIISSPSREMVINNQSMELIQTNAEINSGNSGGGLFDGNGNLVGIVNAKDSGTTSSGTVIEGIGFAIPINSAMKVADELIQYGKVIDRATLGVYLQEVSSNYFNYTPGLYITGTANGSGAEKAGLKAYDRIVSADGNEINSQSDLTKVLRDKNVGDTISLTIERNGKQMDVQVTLGSSGSTSQQDE